MDTGRYASW